MTSLHVVTVTVTSVLSGLCSSNPFLSAYSFAHPPIAPRIVAAAQYQGFKVPIRNFGATTKSLREMLIVRTANSHYN